MGRRLFERRHRGLELTPLGQMYFPLVRSAFEQLAQATALIGGIGDQRRTLTISCTPSFAMAWLIARLPGFQAAHPEIEVRLDTSTRIVDFKRDGVDVAIRFGKGTWPGVAAERLFTETLFPVCSPALLAAKGGVETPSDLARFTLIHIMPYVDDWRLWLTAAGVTGIDPERGPRFDSSIAAYKAAEEGLGMAVGRGLVLEEALTSGRLVAPFDIRLGEPPCLLLRLRRGRRAGPQGRDVPRVAPRRGRRCRRARHGEIDESHSSHAEIIAFAPGPIKVFSDTRKSPVCLGDLREVIMLRTPMHNRFVEGFSESELIR